MPCRAVPRWRWQQAVTTSEPSDASNCDVVVPYNKRLRHTRKHPNAMFHISYFLDSMVSVAWQQCAVFSRLDSTVVNQMTAAADTSIPCPLLRRPFLRINYGRYVRTYCCTREIQSWSWWWWIYVIYYWYYFSIVDYAPDCVCARCNATRGGAHI